MGPATGDRELTVLSQFSQVLDLAMDLNQALDRLLEILSEALATRRAFISLMEPQMGRFTLGASLGGGEVDAEAIIVALETGGWQQPRTAFQIPVNGLAPVLLEGSLFPSRREVAWLGAPLIIQGKSLGVFCVDRFFTDDVAVSEDLRFLRILASLVAHLAGLHQEMAGSRERWGREAQFLKEELTRRWRLVLVGQSPAIREISEQLPRAAAARRPLLLLGEPGTGKLWLARLLHALGAQAHQPFGVWPTSPPAPAMLEALLGGGDPWPAPIGSLFLQEAADLSPGLQEALSLFLAAQEAGPPEAEPTTVVRIMAATTQDLTGRAATGQFRADLLRQLSAFTFFLPPLRHRPQDIPPLLEVLLQLAAQDYGRPLQFSPQVLECCTRYDWPGNLLEMANLVERLAISAPHPMIEARDLPGYLLSGVATEAGLARPARSRLKELELREVVAALERHRWVQSQAAEELGLTLRQIGYRVKQFGLAGMVKSRRGRGGAASVKG